jgi:hypothetical protein
MFMFILKEAEGSGDWVTAVICDRWVQAKVFNLESTYGVYNGRVSKIAIAKQGVSGLGSETGLDFFENVDFNWDRGLDFCNFEKQTIIGV